MSGAIRPSGSRWPFQSVNGRSSSSARALARRDAPAGPTRRRRGTGTRRCPTRPSRRPRGSSRRAAGCDAFGTPRLLAMPAIVRRYALSLKRSAASTIASSVSESRRRIGSSTTGSTVGLAGLAEQRRRESRAACAAGRDEGVVGTALLQPAVLERRCPCRARRRRRSSRRRPCSGPSARRRAMTARRSHSAQGGDGLPGAPHLAADLSQEPSDLGFFQLFLVSR